MKKLFILFLCFSASLSAQQPMSWKLIQTGKFFPQFLPSGNVYAIQNYAGPSPATGSGYRFFVGGEDCENFEVHSDMGLGLNYGCCTVNDFCAKDDTSWYYFRKESLGMRLFKYGVGPITVTGFGAGYASNMQALGGDTVVFMVILEFLSVLCDADQAEQRTGLRYTAGRYFRRKIRHDALLQRGYGIHCAQYAIRRQLCL